MAEAGTSEMLTQSSLFYCHKCSIEIVPQLPDYVCPQCQSGFIEPTGQRSSNSEGAARPGSSSAGGGYDGDSDDHSNSSSFDGADDLEPSFGAIGNILIGGGGPFNSLLLGGPSDGGGTSSTAAEASVVGGGAGPGAARRPHNRRILNALLMGPPNRRSRMRGPERHQVLAPMLQDLIVHITSGVGPVPMFPEELASNPGDYAWGRGGLDAVITHLMNQLDGNGPPPLTQTQIDTIPTVAISEQQIENNAQCSVCMDDFKPKENVKQLHCDHYFHESCISPWLKMHATCPVCRKSLNEGASGAQAGQPQQATSRLVLTPSSSSSNTFYLTNGPPAPPPTDEAADHSMTEEDLD